MKKIAVTLLLLLIEGMVILQLARIQQDEIAKRRSNAVAHSIEERPIYYGGR